MLWCAIISGIMPEVSIDPMKVVEDAVLEFTDKKDYFLAYMSSMLVGDQGTLEYLFFNIGKLYYHRSINRLFSLFVLGEPATPVVNVVTEKGVNFIKPLFYT